MDYADNWLKGIGILIAFTIVASIIVAMAYYPLIVLPILALIFIPYLIGISFKEIDTTEESK